MAKGSFCSVLLLAAFFLVQCLSLRAVDYRIDSQAKFDYCKNKTFEPGDRILLKKGLQFTGMFAPKGEGTAEAPIILSTYGEGARPIIDAEGKHNAALFLNNIVFWEVSGLELTNPYKNQSYEMDNHHSILPEKKLFGLLVLLNGEEKTYEHIYIDDCYVRDVNDMVGQKEHGGIHVRMVDLNESKVHDLRITSNRIERVGGVGLANQSSCAEIFNEANDIAPRHLWTNVYVADNYIHTTGRNSIIARVSKDAIYERNVLAFSSRADTGHSIFCFNTDGIKIQYNEAYGNLGVGRDRGGFDADYNCINTYIQYNYSHNNEWFCGFMRKPQRNIIVRYNVSQNDRSGIYYYGFKKAVFARELHIYNNTHYVSKDLDVEVFAKETPPLHSTYENNIFYFEGKGQWGEEYQEPNSVFRNNVYFNLDPHPGDAYPKTEDPRFVQPGLVGTDIDLTSMKALEGYRLSPDSPYLDGSVPIPDNGGVNILGEPLPAGQHRFGAL